MTNTMQSMLLDLSTMMVQKITVVSVVVLKIFSIVSVVIGQQTTLKGPMDVCERDVFNGTCPSGEVIIMQSAMYGRMKIGRCIQEYMSKKNCDMDVLYIMDGICSGLQSCTVRPWNPLLLDIKPCRDHAAYLSLSYKCIQDAGQLSTSCSSNMAIGLPSGYLFSSPRSVYGPGTIACPWTLTSEGQRYNISLFKFVPFKNSPLSSSSSVCFEIGTIEEDGLAQVILTCGSDPREKVIFISKGEPIRIHFKDTNFLVDLENFALHFNELGCPDPTIPRHATYKRSGEIVMVSCSNSADQWEVTCKNGKWEGDIGECPEAEESSSLLGWIKHNTKFSLGLLALVTLGCAFTIFLGGFCIYVTSFYLKGKHRQQNGPSADYNYATDLYKLQTIQRLKRPPSAIYERTTSLQTPPGTMRRNTDYQRMNPIDPDTVSHHSYVLYDHVPKPLPPIPMPPLPVQGENNHIYETPHMPGQQQ